MATLFPSTNDEFKLFTKTLNNHLTESSDGQYRRKETFLAFQIARSLPNKPADYNINSLKAELKKNEAPIKQTKDTGFKPIEIELEGMIYSSRDGSSNTLQKTQKYRDLEDEKDRDNFIFGTNGRDIQSLCMRDTMQRLGADLFKELTISSILKIECGGYTYYSGYTEYKKATGDQVYLEIENPGVHLTYNSIKNAYAEQQESGKWIFKPDGYRPLTLTCILAFEV